MLVYGEQFQTDYPGQDEKKTARLSGPQASHQLKSLVAANGLLVAGEEIELLEPGQIVEVRLL